MRDRPSISEVLLLARRILRERLLEHIPPEEKYETLMIANAMAIAARQLSFGEEPEREELKRIQEILGDEKPSETGVHTATELLSCYERLCKGIRSGEHAPSSKQYKNIYRLLRDQARQKVLESNPGYLVD